jgi:putative acetyltransferase
VNDIAIVRTYAATDDARVLVGELEAALAADYPPEQRHGLAFDAIFQPHVRFFVASLDGAPAGCGGVAIFDDFAEVKRMYVRPALRGRGVAQALLARIEAETRAAGRSVLRLETGIRQPAAIRVYERAGFARCAPFGEYRDLPPPAIATSLFYEKALGPDGG